MIRQLTGAMIPGQFGPTRRVLFCDFSMSVMRTMSVVFFVNSAAQW